MPAQKFTKEDGDTTPAMIQKSSGTMLGNDARRVTVPGAQLDSAWRRASSGITNNRTTARCKHECLLRLQAVCRKRAQEAD